MTNSYGDSVNGLALWIQQNTGNGPITNVYPLNTISQSEIDLYQAVVSNMGDFFDDPLNYNIENYDPSIFGLISTFRNSIKTIVVGVASAVGTALVVAAVTAIAAGTLAAVAVAVVTVVAIAAVAVAVAYALAEIAVDDLEAGLNDLGYDTSNATSAEIIALGKIADILKLH